jgi:TrmH family RNA methyltransferase
MGSFVRVNVWYRPLAGFLDQRVFPVYGALLNGKNMHGEPPVTEGMLVIGNEGKGSAKTCCCHLFLIPSPSRV